MFSRSISGVVEMIRSSLLSKLRIYRQAGGSNAPSAAVVAAAKYSRDERYHSPTVVVDIAWSQTCIALDYFAGSDTTGRGYHPQSLGLQAIHPFIPH